MLTSGSIINTKELLRGVGRNISFDFHKSQIEHILSRDKCDLFMEVFKGDIANCTERKVFESGF